MIKVKKLVLAAVSAALISPLAVSAEELKASHQWPGGKGDIRDEMVQMIARHMNEKKYRCQYQSLPGQVIVQT